MSADVKAVERRLRDLLRAERGVPRRLRDAMAHSLFAGGKRLRPRLLLGAYDSFAGDRISPPADRDTALDAAAAVEMIHTYSLIHDDLPAMDDDDLRRGRPTCHVAFDEATAILAGDALQARAFAVLAQCRPAGAELVAVLARAAGPGGMVGGQQSDLDAEGLPLTAALVRRIHDGKTAALIAASLEAGALLAGAAAEESGAVAAAGRRLGLAFQAADDVLDVTADRDRLGKTPGKDADAAKPTWVRLEGLEKARRRRDRYGREGSRMLAVALPPGAAAESLLKLAGGLWRRDR